MLKKTPSAFKNSLTTIKLVVFVRVSLSLVPDFIFTNGLCTFPHTDQSKKMK